MIISKIAAGIVLFNPEDQNRLMNCIQSVLNQIDRIYIFDNSTERQIFQFSDNVIYMTERENKGIAYALNRIMDVAKKDKYEWVITMDQDSILPDGTLTLYEQYIKLNERIGILCPQVIDSRRIYMEVKVEPKIEYVDFCITSASCTRIDAWEQIGKFDEWLFIDLVDNEFCKRLIVSGYTILRLNELVLDQEFGKIIPKCDKVQQFWLKVSKLFHNNNFAKFGYKKFVNPIRVYYTNRNIIYINRKLRYYGTTGYENYNCKGYFGFLISFSVPSILRAQEKGKVIKAVFTGIRDGKRWYPNPWSVKKCIQEKI